MAKVIPTKKPNAEGDPDSPVFIVTGYKFICPGCGDEHRISTNKESGYNWDFNNDLDSPTFKPSLLAKSGHYVDSHKGDCWCDYKKKNPEKDVPFKCGVCHSFITNGQIRFLNDCTHELAGQTIELPEIE